jgi:perosamine synthetase
MIIPYGKQSIDEEDIQAVVEVLRGSLITQGPLTEKFGESIASYCGARYGSAVSSGTAALHIAVAALDIKEGDEVITTPMTFCATSNSVLYQGGKVVFVDIDPDTLNIDHKLVEQKITSRTKAIIPVDFRGHPAPLPELRRIADKHGLKIIEDASHALGSQYTSGAETFRCGDCRHADLAVFSFHPVKHITTGEGGAITVNDDKLYRTVSLLRKHGIDRREEMFSEKDRRGAWFYEMEMLGFNYRMTDFQSALGMSQLKKLPRFLQRRREIVEYYNQHLKNIEEFILPHESPHVRSNFHLYVLQVKQNKKFDRYDLFNHLHKLDYRPMIHYIPVHLLPYYSKHFGYKRGDFPNAERYYDRCMSIPLYQSLTDAQVEKITLDLKHFAAKI